MSDILNGDRTFFARYELGLVTAARVNDFVDAWHDSGEEEQRSLAEYLGVTDEEYGAWFITPRALPAILAARRSGRPLRDHVEAFYQALRAAGDPDDRPPLFAFAHWLGRPEDA